MEEKPEVKKAGGVFYTPEYIVRYIVENTIGKLIEGKTPTEISGMRFADIACGSGSFLLGAYDCLLRYHANYYNKNLKQATARDCIMQDGALHLTLHKKREILLNNIYGVDIDQQAVEVSQLSLYLKLLENETLGSTAASLRAESGEAVLPSLNRNIQCGNSLVEPDFYVGVQEEMALYESNKEEVREINSFDWHSRFPEIMRNGGFDAVIGNPPWGASFIEQEQKYLIEQFPLVPTKTKDSYFYFICSALENLKVSGFLGFIVPNTWLLINNAAPFRKEILNYNILEIVDFGDGVFKDAIVESSTVILRKERKGTAVKAIRQKRGKTVTDHFVKKELWRKDEYCRIVIEADVTTYNITEKLNKTCIPFGQKCSIIFGIKPYQVGYGIPPQTKEAVEKRIFHCDKKKGKEWKPLLVGTDVKRYSLNFPGNQYIKYGKWLMYPSNEKQMLHPKVFLRRTSDDLKACYDEDQYYGQNSLFIINSIEVNLKYLLGLLNSRLLNYVYKKSNPQTGKIFAEIKPSVIKQLPIRQIDSSSKKEKSQHDEIVSLVTSLLSLHKQLPIARTDFEKNRLSQQIESADHRIDELVYALYGLTSEEINIVEESSKKSRSFQPPR